MDSGRYDALKIDNQLCFPLYACSRLVIKQYKPFLDRLDLTYTQYIALMVLWEEQSVTVKALGDKLFLDSGTLTPLLKKLEHKGLVTRTRSSADERNLIVAITPQGMALRDEALSIPGALSKCLCLTGEEAGILYGLLHKLLDNR